MGLHAAIFSPAKYGIVPEMLGDRDLSRGNALLEMSTFVAIVLGIAGGGVLFAAVERRAVAHRARHAGHRGHRLRHQLAASRASSHRALPSASAGIPSREIAGSTRHLIHDKPLWLAVLGVSYFWFAGVLMKTGLQYFGKDVLRADDSGVSLLWAFLAIGIGVGNMLAGRLSGDKVELGLVPLGAALMGFFALALVAVRHSFAAVHRRGRLPGDGQRTLRGAALRLHPAAQRRAAKRAAWWPPTISTRPSAC